MIYNTSAKLFFRIKENVPECGHQFYYTEKGLCLYENRNLNEINKLHQKIKTNKLDQKALANFTITDLDSFQFNIIKHINNYRSKCCNSFHLKNKKTS